MFTFFVHIRSLLIFVILIQYVSLYKLNVLNTNQLDLSSSSSFSEDLSSPIDDGRSSNVDEDNLRIKRSITSLFGKQPLPQRRSNRPHWNPLVAAYKRCGEYTSYEDRQSCFKNAVQILFVHKLRK